MLKALCVAVAMFLVQAAMPAAATAEDAEWPKTIGPDGYGPYRIGTPIATLVERDLVTPPHKGNDPDECYLAETPGQASATSRDKYTRQFAIYRNRLARIDVDDPQAISPDGLHVGDPVAKLLATYANNAEFQKRNAAALKAGDFKDDVRLIVAMPPGGSRGIAYVVFDNEIGMIRVGELATLTWHDENCPAE